MADLTQFLELFNPLPGNHYIQVTTEVDYTTDALYEMLQKKSGLLRIAYYRDGEMPDIQKDYPQAHIQHVKNFVHPYRALPRDNDMVIYKDIFSKHHKPQILLKTAYTTLANTAEIIIMEKKGVLDIQNTIDMLSDSEYRAANYIDVLPEYDLFMAKKMHMWGNGL
jgi:hypothetical protein